MTTTTVPTASVTLRCTATRESPVRLDRMRARPAAAEKRPCLFVREGESWAVRYSGATFRLRDGKGVRYLAELLACPGRELAALALVAAERRAECAPRAHGWTITGERLEGTVAGDAGDVLDPRARAAYRERLAVLEEQVEEGERFNDPERAASARAEIEALTAQLSAALGLSGRARRMPGPAERARQSVTKAIRAAIRRVREHDPELADHLDRAVATGALCSYDPDPRAAVTWVV